MSDPDKFKADLISEVKRGLEAQGVTDVDPVEFEVLVTATVWDEALEFSHFTDEEIATAMEQLPERSLPTGTHEGVVAFVARARAERWSLTKRNKTLSKRRLAEALWPAMKAKIDIGLELGGRMPPLVDVVWNAHSPRSFIPLVRGGFGGLCPSCGVDSAVGV